MPEKNVTLRRLNRYNTNLVNAANSHFAPKATTLSGYNITDAYTKTEVDSAIASHISSAYKAGGSKAAAEVTSALLVADNEGIVYNVSEDFTTTADFVEGAGKKHPAGTNIVVVNTGDSTTAVYKFDVLAGFVDLTGYATLDDIEEATEAEIDAIISGQWPQE